MAARPSQGQLDEIQLFDRALSAGEVLVLAESAPGGSCRPCAALPEGAIAWWRAEDDFDDSVGRFNGTPVNGVPFDDWKVGRAFVFDGSQDYVALPNDDVWDFGAGSFSISAWIQTERSGYRNIIRYHNGSTGGYWGLRTETTGRLQFIVADEAGYQTEVRIVSTDVVNDETPHLVTAVRDATAGELKLYVDGRQAAAPVPDNDVDIVGAADAFPAIGALAYPGGSAGEYFAGYVDEVAVFDRALSAEEAAAVFAAGGRGICHDCVGAALRSPLVVARRRQRFRRHRRP